MTARDDAKGVDMRQRLLAVTVALIATTATAAPAQGGFGSSPGSLGQEMDHGRSAATAPAVAGPGRIAQVTADSNQYGEWIADVERPPEGLRRR